MCFTMPAIPPTPYFLLLTHTHTLSLSLSLSLSHKRRRDRGPLDRPLHFGLLGSPKLRLY
jgi:hypothetical protein